MQQATVVVQRLLARLRLDLTRRTDDATTIGRQAHDAIGRLRHRQDPIVVAATDRHPGESEGSSVARPPAARTPRRSGAHRASPVGRSLFDIAARANPSSLRFQARSVAARLGGAERILPISVAALVLVASILSVAPAAGTPGGTGNTDGSGTAPRLAIGGLDPTYGEVGVDVAPPEADSASGYVEAPPAEGATGANDPANLTAIADGALPADVPDGAEAASPQPDGPYLADGTLLKPVAVDTTVPDGSDKLREYRVQSGDTLTGIARRFGVSMMTVWWANDLASKDDLHVGQTLVIPPVTGLVVDVKDGDTLDSIAAAAGASADEIVAYNGLEDRNVIIGQTLVIPGARGEAIPTPKPAPQSNSGNGNGGGGRGGGSGGGSVRPPGRFNGGSFAWPVSGGYISQYFRYGHYGLDIAADYGTPIHAAAAGTVIYAGWKSNGGGYQVWIAHGSGLYTTYNHMSAVSVAVGEHVSRGERVGRVGTSGWATGPHLHFETWRGEVWNGGSRVNPLNYL